MARKILLICGILASLLYVGSDILAAMRWEGYSYMAQSVSELRGIGAPTRAFLLPILFIYSLLEIAFGLGVWGTAPSGLAKRGLRITGGLLIGLGILDLMGPFFQLNLGEAVGSFTNTLHLLMTVVTVLLILMIIGFGATADGKWFRFYSYATILILIVTGGLAFLDVPRIAANLPTPWMGVRERINIYGYMLWMLLLAVTLLRAPAPAATGKPPSGIGVPQLTPH
ncbi:MAG: DUF998 domain-containing protein [Caldilineaceae bacterium]|nr:DUF998 domain-containing protein [Caldilineaceae bacterium]